MSARASRSVERYDAIVLGAGGAGLMCAGLAGQRGVRTCVIDHADAPGKKILISGGGRCNFTNLDVSPERYLSDNPHFAKSALSRYTPADFIALVDAHGIAWHEKTLGQLFCDGRARQIVDMLLAECTAGEVSISLAAPIRSVTHADGCFTVTTETAVFEAPALVIATGGPSIPKMGATGFAYALAAQFGLGVVTPRPALVPMTLDPERDVFEGLTGVATPVIARAGPMAFPEACLFTHRGLSGPAILQISSYWQPGAAISLDFFPHQPDGWLKRQKLKRPKITVRTALKSLLPDRLANALDQRIAIAGPLAELADRTIESIERQLAAWPFTPIGTEGFAKAEVTAGGVDTADLSSRTMAAKTVPGLYVIGEAVDVTGWLGGYNFQWAWASAHAAAMDLATKRAGTAVTAEARAETT